MSQATTENDQTPDSGSLYRWQLEALQAWLRCGRRGVVEAVTGSGKTNLAIAAVSDAHRRGLFVLVVVPSRVLLSQWHERLAALLPDCKVGRLGDGHRGRPSDCDILIATRHSAASFRPAPPNAAGGLLIADECHGYGGQKLRRSLLRDYNERLGLTATLERSDDAVEKILIPYFGGVCYRYGFHDAISDGVCAQPRVAFVSVALSSQERDLYVATEQKLVQARSVLRSIPDMPLEPFGVFLAAVSYLAEHDAGANGAAAKDYLTAFGHRRDIVASSTTKYEALGSLVGSIESADGALIFTETVRAANHAVNRLDPDINIELITGSTARTEREKILDGLKMMTLDAVASPRVLDEGIDVPNVNLGIVVSASRTRRQMIQRMGRVLRRKVQGSGARFVIIFARDTIEDPIANGERDGFLEEIEQISESCQVFDESERSKLGKFLNYSGPSQIIDPLQLGPMAAGENLFEPTASHTQTSTPLIDQTFMKSLTEGHKSAWRDLSGAEGKGTIDAVAEMVGPETLYAFLNYLPWDQQTWLHDWVQSKMVVQAHSEPEYLELEMAELPQISKPKPKRHLLSTGQQPVGLVQLDNAWVMRCFGCGATSSASKYKWQARDLTVECSCTEW